jgi:hypothetical protein
MENVREHYGLPMFQEETFAMNNVPDQNTVILCDCGCDKCPILERQENTVVIQDDFGGKAVLTGDQWKLLLRLIEQKHFAGWTFEPSLNQ